VALKTITKESALAIQMSVTKQAQKKKAAKRSRKKRDEEAAHIRNISILTSYNATISL
jgi:hypothetical protein